MRKIQQIAVSSEGETTYPCVYALCDDGSLWLMANKPHLKYELLAWDRLPPIPQDDAEVQP